ncbi:MAG: hypothetical protein JW751_12600 [Polyangiaceae bacterium]|nr:hypothetical protein [Polyangiaceae bacterium]
MNRRLYAMLAKRLDEADLDGIPDGRGIQGQKWELGSLLRAVVGGMVAGKQSLAEVEMPSVEPATMSPQRCAVAARDSPPTGR